MSKAKNGEEPSFEEAYNRLEETVHVLEEGGLSLDRATRLFEEGMSLARICNELLSSAELRITRLQTAYGEQMRLLTEEKEDNAEG
jgi:exodeoxyribonuclease VII small subunit